MNYPYFESLQNFWVDEDATSRDFMYALERVYSLYPEQVNRVLFNHLDTHDTMRALTRCGDLDVFRQQQAALLTMPGSPCIYYGTEIAMPGGHDPDCRRTMPWGKIEAGEFASHQAFTKGLITLRNEKPQLKGERILWHHDETHPRLVCYDRPGETETIRVYLNAAEEDIPLNANPLFSYQYENELLKAGGILICSL
jgi:glycosidase